MRWLLPLLIIIPACGHAPPPPPKVQVAVGGLSDLSGSYTGGNEIDWGYFLTIGDKGQFNLVVDRGKMGRCEQNGTLAAGADKQTYTMTFVKNECDRAHQGQPLTLHVESFTTDELVLKTSGDGVADLRHYMRKVAPASVK